MTCCVVVGPEGGVAPEELAALDRRRRGGRAAGQHGAALVERRPGRARRAQRDVTLALTARSSTARSRCANRRWLGVLAHHDGQALQHGERLLAPVGGEHGGAHLGQVGVGDAARAAR